MKVYVVKSSYSEIPLAEVRESGGIIDFIVDNTEGQIPAKVGNSLATLQAYVKRSSHMTISSPEKVTVNLLRYVMNNGDSVEITSDGHTVVLNGKLLSQQEKDALFDAVKAGKIKVSRKTDVQQALPIMTRSPRPTESNKPVDTKLNPAILKKISEQQKKDEQDKEMSDSSYDHEIENNDFKGCDKGFVKQMMYFLKYGDKK